MVHYRIADQPDGPFHKPEGTIDYVDGAGFYAGRLETDGKALYLAGWIPTKESHMDAKKYNWAGNLAIHQLALQDGRLLASPPQSAVKKVATSTFTEKKIAKGESISLATEKSVLFSGKMAAGTTDTKLALQFGVANHVILEMNEALLYYTNGRAEQETPNRAVTQIPVPLDKKEQDITIIKEGDIVVVYVNGVALSNRMYVTEEQMTLTVLEGSVQLKP